MIGSATDTIIIIVVALILIFGASKLPEIFRNLGKATGEFKKGQLEAEMELTQMQQQLQQSSREKELETKLHELQKQLEELKKQNQSQSPNNK